MYYDDEVRRFNVLSGVVCGALFGAGAALLVASSRDALIRPKSSLRSRLMNTGEQWVERMGREVAGTLMDRIRSR